MADAYDYSPHRWRWCLPALVGFVMFTNHWARDALGTVQAPLEEDFPMSALQSPGRAWFNRRVRTPVHTLFV